MSCGLQSIRILSLKLLADRTESQHYRVGRQEDRRVCSQRGSPDPLLQKTPPPPTYSTRPNSLQSSFRNAISRDPGSQFTPEKGRYHLFVSLACPWAHRTLIVRQLKGLESIIGFSVVHWHMGEGGASPLTPSQPPPH